jgi:pseudaminic acid biosynthesis-associated methylase
VKAQLQAWEGEFGRAYTDRNVVDWHVRVPAFRVMLSGLTLGRVLEVGCNRGHNLLTLSHVLGEETDVVGIEPNRYALGIARSLVGDRGAVLRGNIFDLPFKAGYFDLVLTAGVLIHIPLDSLHVAIRELDRVSGRFMLVVEYFAEQETLIPYRGHDDLLWKRNFPSHFQQCLPGVGLVRSGYWGPEDGFDRAHWWLSEKRAGVA